MDNQHAQAVEQPISPGGVPLIQPWCARPSWGLWCGPLFSFSVSSMATAICQNHITQNSQHPHTALGLLMRTNLFPWMQ